MRPRSWVLLGLLLPAGCASRPGGQGVNVVSDPPGATATAYDYKVKTPGTLYAVPGAREMEIEIRKEGYETETITLRRDGETFGECLGSNLTDLSSLVPPPGTSIDIVMIAEQIVMRMILLAANCHMKAEGLRPTPVFVTLRPIPPELLSPNR